MTRSSSLELESARLKWLLSRMTHFKRPPAINFSLQKKFCSKIILSLNSLEKYSILKIEGVSDIVGWITKARLLIGLLKCSVLQFITATQVLLIDDSFWLNGCSHGWSLNIKWLNWKWQMLQMMTDTVKTWGGQIAVWARPKNFGLAKIQTKKKIWSESMKTKFNDQQIILNRLQFKFKVYLRKIRLFLKS